MSEEEILTIKDVMRRLKVSERTVFTLLNKGELSGFKVGGSWRFTHADIMTYEVQQRQKAQAKHRKPKQPTEEVSQPLACSAA